MNVQESEDLGNGHFIEFGQSSWDENTFSIRNRYPTSTGGFSPHSSSEIPIHDLSILVREAARRDILTRQEMINMIQELADSLDRYESGNNIDVLVRLEE